MAYQSEDVKYVEDDYWVAGYAEEATNVIAFPEGTERYLPNGYIATNYFQNILQTVSVVAPFAEAREGVRAYVQANESYADVNYVIEDYFDDALEIISVSSPIGVFSQSVTIAVTDLAAVVATVFGTSVSTDALIQIGDLPEVSVSQAVADANVSGGATVEIPSVTLSSAEASASGQAEATFGALLVSATAPTATANGTATVSVASGTATISAPDVTASGISSSLVSPSFNIVITEPSAAATGDASSSVTIPEIIVIKPSVYELATEFPNTLPNVIVSAPAISAFGDAATSTDVGTSTVSAPVVTTTITAITNVVTGKNYIRAGFHAAGYFAEETATVSVVTPTPNLIANVFSEVVAPQVTITSLDGVAESSPNVSVDFPSISVSAPEPEEAITESPLALPQISVSSPEVTVASGTGITVSPLGAILYVEEDYVDAGYTDDPVQVSVQAPSDITTSQPAFVSASIGTVNAAAAQASATGSATAQPISLAPVDATAAQASVTSFATVQPISLAPVNAAAAQASATGSATAQPISLAPISVIAPQPFEIVGEFPLGLNPITVSSAHSQVTADASKEVVSETVTTTAPGVTATGSATASASFPEISVSAPQVAEAITEFPETLPQIAISSPQATVIGRAYVAVDVSVAVDGVTVSAPVSTASVSVQADASLPEQRVSSPAAVGFEFDIGELSNERQVIVAAEYRLTFVPAENRVIEVVNI